jgi:NTE family protein
VERGTVGLILSGAGSRGAYEAGALSVLLPLLPDEQQPRIILGTSAGALNAALLAAFADQGADVATKRLLDAWRTLRFENVFKTPRAGALTIAAQHVRRPRGTATGLLDITPLRHTIEEILPTRDYCRNVGDGALDTLGIVASSCSTGRAVVFFEGTPPSPKTTERVRYLRTKLDATHLLASAAFPVAFPPQWIERPGGRGDGDWYIDGGVHLNTPLKPAIDFGADLLLVVGGTATCPPIQPSPDLPPNATDANGQVLHALVVDRLQADLDNLHTVNQFVRLGAPGATATGGTDRRVIGTFVVNPSDDRLSKVAAEVLPASVNSLLRSLGDYRVLGPLTRQSQQPGQFLSYLCFHPEFIECAIEQGQADARAMIGDARTIPWVWP